MLYVLILAIAITCVSCERNALGLGARTNEDTGTLDRSRRCLAPQLSLVSLMWSQVWQKVGGGRRKRSTEGERERFKVTIQADPCAFNNYDANGDDMITRDEIEAIFGDGEAARQLAEALDESGDEKVNEEEFKKDMHKYVEGC